MGIEPTQPDVVRSQTDLTTVRATRLHPLPASSRNHETVSLARDDLADLDCFGNARKIVRDPSRRDAGKETAGGLGVDEDGALDVGRTAPLDSLVEIDRVSVRAAGSYALCQGSVDT